MIQKLLRFHFKTPLHIGSVKLEEYSSSAKMLHSDTLYSAIIATWNTLGMQQCIPDNLTKAGQHLDFTLSSLFPFFQEKAEASPTYFFPKPLGLIQPQNYGEHKTIKKIKYLDLASFKSILQGKFKPTIEQVKKDYYVSDAKKGFDEQFMTSEVFARNAVPRYGDDEKDTKIYYIDRLFFRGNSGLFCIAQFANETIEKQVMGALRYLQDEGLGTDRHVGNGFFALTSEDFTTLDDLKDEDATHSLNLSLFCPPDKPTLTQMMDARSRYEIIQRGGWITTAPYLSFRKKSIYMFREGSIFNTKEFSGKGLQAQGKTVNLRPDLTYLPEEAQDMPPIHRVGRSLFVPIKLS